MPRWPAIATLLSMLACYGTLIAIAALGALGITITLNTGIWAAAIVGFAVLAVIGLYTARGRHGQFTPTLIAAIGCVILIFTSFISYSVIVEALGFGVLIFAVWLDWRLAKAA